MEQKRTYMLSGTRPSPEGTRLLLLFAGGAVSPMMCPADGHQKDDKKSETEERQGKKRAEAEPKQTVDRNEVAGLFACYFGVIRCDIALYIAIYRDSISHIMPYHNIPYIEISYPYPEF